MKNLIELSDRFYAAIDGLVTLNKEFRAAIDPQIRKHLSPAEYALELCTVACNAGRQIGKSEYIRRRACHTSLVIVPTSRAVSDYNSDAHDVLTAEQIADGAAGSKRYSTIFIDEPSFVFKVISKEALYEELAFQGREMTFILIGT